MEIQVSVHDWLDLPMETRLKLREIFKIPKSQGTWVEGAVVRSDGTTYQDLQHITLEKMQAFTDSDEKDFIKLFHATLAKIQEDFDKEMEPQEKADPNAFILEEWAMHLSRMHIQAHTLGLDDHFKLLISNFLPNAKSATPKAPAPVVGEGQGKEAKQKGASSRGVKAEKTGDGSNLPPAPKER